MIGFVVVTAKEERGNQVENKAENIGGEAADRKTEQGFTPGPWTVEDRRRAPLPNIAVVGADGTLVAEAEGVHMRDRLVHGWTHQEADAADARAMANARLMAAAPALYDAAKVALGIIQNGDPRDAAIFLQQALAIAGWTNESAKRPVSDETIPGQA